MNSNQRRTVTHYDPFFVAPPSPPPLSETAATQHGVTGASREAIGREMAIMRDLNGGFAKPPVPLPQLRAPQLAHDHAQRVAALDEKICERGVAIDRTKLLSLGKMRFAQLLAAERETRSERVIGTRCDLTSFASVLFALSQAGVLTHMAVPAPSMSEQLAGVDAQLEAARKIESFADLWKLSNSEPRAVRAIYAFRDIFESLVFGQSLFTWIESDDHVYNNLFARGSSAEKVRLFEAWLSALKGAHYRVNILNSLQAIVFWLAGENSVPPEPHDLARDCFAVRLPSQQQITFAAALFEGWLLAHKDWALWQHVGRVTRTLPDKALLERGRLKLRKRFRSIDVFHEQLAAQFYKRTGDHSEFEPVRHRTFFATMLARLRSCVSQIAALATEENSPANRAPVVARFRDQLLCVGKPKPQLSERIAAALSGTFPRSAFKIEIE